MVDKAAAAEHKAKGNTEFKAGNWADAITHFTNAIKEDPNDHVFYSNRSGCYVNMKQGSEALADAKTCVEKNPTWAKGYGRLGAAYDLLGNQAEALASYEKGLEIDPSNANCKAEAARLQQRQGAPGAGGLFGGPEAFGRLLTNPETAAFCQDPAFLQKLQQLGSDPMQLIQAAQSDPRIMKAVQVMSGVPAPETETKAPEPKKEEPKPEPEPELTEEEKEAKALNDAALEDKRLGTEAYKKKDFETALKCYQAAFEKVPSEMLYLSNQGSVYLEMKEYEKCIEICQKAVEVGREARSDFKKIAKVLGRIGTAYERSGDSKQAVYWYNKSLTEDRTADILSKKQKCEKEAKKAAANAYRDDIKAEEQRNLGNECFKSAQYADAIKYYTESIQRNPDDVRPLSNRAACYQKLMAPAQAIADCDQIIKMDPKFIKGYTRKADALVMMKKPEEARLVYQEALGVDPDNQVARDGVYHCNVAISKKEAGMTPEERRERAMKDPEVQQILRDPVMNAVLEQMQNNPGAAQEHMRNPEIAAKINKLVQAGIIGMK